MTHYIALIFKDEDSDYGVAFPDFPGILTAGKTLDQARRMAEDALAAHLEAMTAHGLEILPPTSLDAIISDPDNAEAVSFMAVQAPAAKPKVRRINITLAEPVLNAIDSHARELGLNRSAYIAEAARHYSHHLVPNEGGWTVTNNQEQAAHGTRRAEAVGVARLSGSNEIYLHDNTGKIFARILPEEIIPDASGQSEPDGGKKKTA